MVGSVRDEFRERGHPLDRTLAVLRQQERTAEVALARLLAPRGRRAARARSRPSRAVGPDLRALRAHRRRAAVPARGDPPARRARRARAARADRRGRASPCPGRALDLIRRALVARCRSARAGSSPRPSVLGRDFTLTAAAEVAQLSREEALDLVDEAARAGVLEASPDDAASWRFTHALFQEAAYAGIAAGERVRLHLRAAERLEREHRDDLEPVIAELAHHHHRALAVGDPARAFACARARRGAGRCARRVGAGGAPLRAGGRGGRARAAGRARDAARRAARARRDLPPLGRPLAPARGAHPGHVARALARPQRGSRARRDRLLGPPGLGRAGRRRARRR